MPVPKFATVLGALLLSKGGRRLAGRHAGKLALATLAFQLWEKRGAGHTGTTRKPRRIPAATGAAGAETAGPTRRQLR